MMDTVGFITDLPHGLVESFKATLDEIHFADLLVHVRDISHPQTAHQKETVLQVLKEIGVSEDIIQSKYLEVWNKIDLVPDRKELDILFESSIQESTYPIIPMSCLTKENVDLLLETVSEMAAN